MTSIGVPSSFTSMIRGSYGAGKSVVEGTIRGEGEKVSPTLRLECIRERITSECRIDDTHKPWIAIGHHPIFIGMDQRRLARVDYQKES